MKELIEPLILSFVSFPHGMFFNSTKDKRWYGLNFFAVWIHFHAEGSIYVGMGILLCHSKVIEFVIMVDLMIRQLVTCDLGITLKVLSQVLADEYGMFSETST